MNDKSGPRQPRSQDAPPPQSAAVFVLTTIGDTTWRMFVPMLVALVAGDQFDRYYGSAPWGLVAGIIIGSLVAGLLIVHQLNKK